MKAEVSTFLAKSMETAIHKIEWIGSGYLSKNNGDYIRLQWNETAETQNSVLFSQDLIHKNFKKVKKHEGFTYRRQAAVWTVRCLAMLENK